MSHARSISSGYTNKPYAEDGAAHDWYRFVLSYPPHLVRDYLQRFGLTEDGRVFDPFCGTGTTLVECKKLGVESVGFEANQMAHFASSVKVDWKVDHQELIEHAALIAEYTAKVFKATGIGNEAAPPLLAQATSLDFINTLVTLEPERSKLLLTNSISPLPLHRTLVLLDAIETHRDERYYNHERLALAKALVFSISNLQFGPEVGVGKAKRDAQVVSSWLENVRAIANDLQELKSLEDAQTTVHCLDARQPQDILERESIDAVITSPPYPNEKDYTRTTRLESVLLGFINSKADLQALKRRLVRSNTRTVYKGDEDDKYIAEHQEIQRIASEIEARRVELGKTSGFERLYAKVTKLYFGGMARHLANLREVLRPGAQLAYVVGDQASYFRVMIRTGELLADIADSLGYQVTGIELFRSRISTATKDLLREETVFLRWPDQSKTLKGLREHHSKGADAMVDGEEVPTNRYAQIIERVFFQHYKEGKREVDFTRNEFVSIAGDLNINLPKNLGDILYSFRYRTPLPASIRKLALEGEHWIIRPAGRGLYKFALVKEFDIKPNANYPETKIPDSTPGLVAKYSLNDEQALLAKLRYNRLIDIFTGITCYSLQNHLRTTIPGMGQVETDEIYIGVDKRGIHHVFPVQAKGGKDRLNVVQIEQDFALCASRFASLVCHPIGAQFMRNNTIALFEFESSEDGVKVASEKHYKLVAPEEVTPDLLDIYKNRLPND